jgi:hypothetical protein
MSAGTLGVTLVPLVLGPRLFRRSKSEPAPVETTVKVGGKGRPTPTRREAEAAAKARAKTPRTRKEMQAAQRSARTQSSQTVRNAMKTGDEKNYPARDRGPERRFIRDFVDARFSLIELVIPLLIVTMILGYSGNDGLRSIGNTVLLVTVLLVIIDMIMLRVRIRRELARRFPDSSLKGQTYYAITRAMQMKFMRLPKSQVKIGQKLPDSYK